MSYEDRIVQNENDDQYRTLKNSATAVGSRVENWMNGATTLHTATNDPAEKAEIVALRDALVANLRTILGV